MNFRFRFQLGTSTAFAVVALGVAAPFWTSPVHAAPADKNAAAMLANASEYWPGRRVLLVLPVTASSTWSANPDLARAIAPLAQVELQQALEGTDKFSTATAHRFSPLLQRGLVEKRLTEADITPFVASPSLEGAQSIIGKLSFDQPTMIADVKLEELIVGGTPKAPTAQLRISGRLFEQGKPEPIKSLELTSRPAAGKTPAARVSAAAEQVFAELARGFVTMLPVPNLVELMPAPPAPAPRAGRRGRQPATPALPGVAPTAVPSSASTVAPLVVAPPAVATPNRLAPTPGVPIVPQLPTGQPPLGVAPGETTER